jgi:hypothetical protein
MSTAAKKKRGAGNKSASMVESVLRHRVVDNHFYVKWAGASPSGTVNSWVPEHALPLDMVKTWKARRGKHHSKICVCGCDTHHGNLFALNKNRIDWVQTVLCGREEFNQSDVSKITDKIMTKGSVADMISAAHFALSCAICTELSHGHKER